MTKRVELLIAERFPFAGGHEFGAVGAYERLVGRAQFAVDPHGPARPEAGRSQARQPFHCPRLWKSGG